MKGLPEKADEVEELLKERGPMTAREVQANIKNLSWVDTIKIVEGEDRFVKDDKKRYHLTSAVE